MKNKIYYKPGPQSENLGDALINREAVKNISVYGELVLLAKNLPTEYVSTIISDTSSKVSQNGIIEVFQDLLRNLIDNKEKRTIYLCLPPGHIKKEGIKALFSGIKLLVFSVFFRLLGGRITRLGHSIHGQSKFNGFLESVFSRLTIAYGVRDLTSLEYCKRFNFRNFFYFPDFAWGANLSSNDKVIKNNIVISLRSNSHGEVHNENYLERHILRLKEIIKLIDKSQYKIIISYQVDFDEDAAKQVFLCLSTENMEIELIDKCLNLNDAEKLYESAEYVFSNRLHVLMLAGLYGSVPVALINKNDNEKIKSLFNNARLGSCLIEVNESCTENFSRIHKNKNELKFNFEKESDKNRILISESIQKIFS